MRRAVLVKANLGTARQTSQVSTQYRLGLVLSSPSSYRLAHKDALHANPAHH